jgi:hypothetical protein
VSTWPPPDGVPKRPVPRAAHATRGTGCQITPATASGATTAADRQCENRRSGHAPSVPATPSTGLVNQRPTHCADTEQVASSPRRAAHKRFAEGPIKCIGMSPLILCNITGGYQNDSGRKDRESEGKRGMKREQIRCEPMQRTHPVTHAALALRLRCDLALVPTKARRHAVPEPSMSSAATAAW